jgi:hypothetical protein
MFCEKQYYSSINWNLAVILSDDRGPLQKVVCIMLVLCATCHDELTVRGNVGLWVFVST